MKPIFITLDEAKTFLISYQGLDVKTKTDKTINILNTFRRLGCIQYDPLNVVGRNPDLVLQSRIHHYNANDLTHLLYEDRQLIDAWDKMMAIYPIDDWPNFHRVRIRHGQGVIHSLQYRNSMEALDFTDSIKNYIIENGPLQSSKLKGSSASKSRWGHKKLTSAALDYLYSKGELGISSKSNTQKVYDLIENILPKDILCAPDSFVSDKDYIDWYVLRRINAIGFLWNKNGGAWLGYFTHKKGTRSAAIKRLLQQHLIQQVMIDSIDEPFYISTINLPLLDASLSSSIKRPKQVRFLAPLDNLMWDRDFIETLFNFNYRWEVYTPLAKREFGYYVLPILYGNNLIGRIEFDYYRGDGDVKILNRWFEPSFKTTKGFERAFEKELKAFQHYLKKSYSE